jgi:hypothetical protein
MYMDTEVCLYMKHRSSRTLGYWVEKGYSQNDAEVMRMSRTPGTIEYFEIFKGMSHDDAIVAREEFQSKRCNTLKNMILKYGDIDGKRRFEQYKEKQSKSNTFEYKKEKHGWNRKQFDEFNKSRAVTLDNLIKKHGEVKGRHLYKEYCDKQSFNGNKLEYFVKKLGPEDGVRKYNEINVLKSHTFESYLLRNNGNIEQANIQYNDYLSKCRCGHSRMANEFFNSLYEMVKTFGYKQVYYNDLNQEWVLRKKKGKAIFLDFFIKDIGKVVEFYGDFCHANPKIYTGETMNFPGNPNKIISEIHQSDKDRIDTIMRVPYIRDVKIVWESEYVENPMKIIEDCKEFLKC